MFWFPVATWLAQSRPAGAFRETQHDLYVVVQAPAGHESGEFGGQLPAIQSGHKAGEIVSVSSDVSQRTGGTALRWIGAPGGLFLSGLLQWSGQPVLRIFNLDHANRSQFSTGDHLPSLAHQGIAGVVVGHGKEQPGAAHGPLQVLGILESGGERLVADDVDASLEKCFRRRIVQMVRGHDGDGINAIFSGRFRRGHFRKTAVCPLRNNVKVQRSRSRPRRIGRQRRRHQLKAIVKPGRDAMHRPDKSARTTAYHAQAQATAWGFVALYFKAHGFILLEPRTEN